MTTPEQPVTPTVGPHPTGELEELVHQRGRLGILTVLAEKDRADFGYLQRTLSLTQGNLGRHIDTLASAGLVHIEKGYAGRRPRTWITITKPGRKALASEMSALRELLNRYEATDEIDP